MKIYNNEQFSTILILLLCSVLIVSTNYIFTKQITRDVQKQLTQNEYDNIWWKDNYTILKELQKQEMLTYIDKLKQENPELIYKMRQNALAKESEDRKMLTWEAVKDLKENAYVKWNSGATVTIIEFSDMECPFCIAYHNGNAINRVMEKYKDTNYIFKNFPLPTHKKSWQESLAAKCVEKIGTGEKYGEFVNMIFSGSTVWEGGFNLDTMPSLITTLWVNEADFNTCYKNEENATMIKKEFEQWLKLGINSTPSTVIVNNKTGEYKILTGNIAEKDLEKAVTEFLNKN